MLCAVRKLIHKLLRLRKLDSVFKLLVSFRIGTLAKENIFSYASCKKHSLLCDISKLVIKGVKLVVFYVYAVHEDFTLCCVIKSWYKAYKRCLAASCCTDYGKGLTLVYLKAYVAQLVLRGMRISERNIFELNSALLSSLADASLFYVHVTLKHFVDTLCRYLSRRQHHEYHNEHHK